MELTKYLLVHTGAKFILSERFNQDSLESHFGKHRQMKGGNDNLWVLKHRPLSVEMARDQALCTKLMTLHCRKDQEGQKEKKIKSWH